ncbi:MAG: NAD(P)/FAD-dependent oxidoreductase [Spirochaetales bacterium]|nr:NAD(P)/FAD-dependent oxidoreductase [Spirochaetales bacterium]
MTYDTIIIGKGPAGISAALYLVRSGYTILVLGSSVGALERAETIENYYGFPQALSGSDLASRGIAQAERLGVEIRSEEVVHLGMEELWSVKTDAATYTAKTVLLATGKSRSTLKVPGFEEYRGKGISFCVTCDGFLYRGKTLALLGAGEYAANEWAELGVFTQDRMVFTNGAEVTGTFPADTRFITQKITAFTGADTVTGITTEDGTTHPVQGVFVALGTAGATSFAATLGIELTGTDIVVDSEYMTNIPGIFAAGDCTGGFLQIAKAVSDGALAAKGIHVYLKKIFT